MEKTKKNIFSWIVFWGALVSLILLILWRRQDARLIIYYDEYSEGMNSQLFFDVGEGYSEKYSCYNKVLDKTEFVFPEYISSIKGVRGDFSDRQERVYIKNIEIRKNPLNRLVLSAEDIIERVDFTVNLKCVVDDNRLVIDNITHDGQIYFKDIFVDEIINADRINVLELMLFIMSGILGVYILLHSGQQMFVVLKKNQSVCEKHVIVALGVLLINMMIVQMGATFSIRYYAEKTDGSASLYWVSDQNSSFSEYSSAISPIKNGNARLHTLKRLPMSAQYRIDFINDFSNVNVKEVKLYYGIVPLVSFNGEELYHHICTAVNIKNIRLNNNVLCIEPQTSDPIVYLDLDFAKIVNREVRRGCLILCFITNILIAIVVFYSVKYRKELHDYTYAFDMKYRNRIITILKILICFGLVVSAILVVYMAMYSEFNAHPDEWVTRKAIDYYLSNWIPPDIRNETIADTFSGYGHSRLEELTIYYLLSGKIGCIFNTLFHCANYYRVFNICLYIIICFVIIKSIWEESWLAVCGIATPQLCYIFSYATSDAWDYFCSFLLIYQIVAKDSKLNINLRTNNGKKKYVWLAFFGVLSALIFMGKTNYYVVLLLAFIIFLFKLIKAEHIEKKQLLKNYVYILLFFVFAFMARYSFNLYYYGFNQTEIFDQVREMRAMYAYKSSTPMEDLCFGLRLKEQGVSLEEVCDKYNFGGMSYKSFCGVYGYMNLFSASSYYIILGTGYMVLILLLIVNILNLNTIIDKIEYFMIGLVGFISVFASMYHSWTSDYQPQGRYLLPMLIGIGYLISKIEDRNMKTLCILVMASISIIVPYGFYNYGILKMI